MNGHCGNCKYAREVSGSCWGRYCKLTNESVDYRHSCIDWDEAGHSTLKDVIEYIAGAYGLSHQTIKLFEEQGELTQALAKLILDAGPSSVFTADLGNITEELADVQLMLWQIMYLLSIDFGEIEAMMKAKADRQINRMNDSNVTDASD